MPAISRQATVECRLRKESGNTDGFFLDRGANAVLEAALGDEVDITAKEIFEKDPQLHELREGWGFVEGNQEVHITVVATLPASD